LEALEKIVWKLFGEHEIFALLDYIFMPWVVVALLIAIAQLLRVKFPMVWKTITGSRIIPP